MEDSRRSVSEQLQQQQQQQQLQHQAEVARMMSDVAKAEAASRMTSEMAKAAVANERAASEQRLSDVVGAAGEALDRRAAEVLEERTKVERAKHLAHLAFSQAQSASEANAGFADINDKLK